MTNANKILSDLEKIIIEQTQNSHSLSPIVLSHLLCGPIGVDLEEEKRLINIGNFSEDLVSRLNNDSKLIRQNYCKNIFPILPTLFSSILNSSIKIPIKEEEEKFEILTYENIREIFKNSYNGEFELDEITLNELNSTTEMNIENDSVHFYHDNANNYLFSFRVKSKSSITNKIKTLYDKSVELGDSQIPTYLRFLSKIVSNDDKLWTNEFRSEIENGFGKNALRMVFGDYLGFSIIDLNPKRGLDLMENLAYKGNDISSNGFIAINDRYKNHLDFLDEKRPGGFHYVLNNLAFPNYPFELKIQPLEGGIYTIFGPNKHSRYESLGKKASGKYEDNF